MGKKKGKERERKQGKGKGNLIVFNSKRSLPGAYVDDGKEAGRKWEREKERGGRHAYQEGGMLSDLSQTWDAESKKKKEWEAGGGKKTAVGSCPASGQKGMEER